MKIGVQIQMFLTGASAAISSGKSKFAPVFFGTKIDSLIPSPRTRYQNAGELACRLHRPSRCHSKRHSKVAARRRLPHPSGYPKEPTPAQSLLKPFHHSFSMLARAMADSALSAGAFIRRESSILPSDSPDLTRKNASDSAISRNNAGNHSFSAKRASNPASVSLSSLRETGPPVP